MTPQELQDNIEAKKILFHKADRANNTDKLVAKLDELKPKDKIEISNFPEPVPTDLNETNKLLTQLIEEQQKPLVVRLTLD